MIGSAPEEKNSMNPKTQMDSGALRLGDESSARSEHFHGRTLRGVAPPDVPAGAGTTMTGAAVAIGKGAPGRIASALTQPLDPALDLGDSDVLPRQFGRLTLLRRLAKGGMGEVYLAATRGIEGAERPCVVKTIRQEHSTDKSFRARFLDETRIQAQLAHPGVAQILEAATLDDGRPYAVVEYVEGRHLGEVQLRSNQLGVRIAWADAVAVGICFGDALAHLHERTDASGRPLDIAHRDLSPQNVMLGYSGDLKLIDFGTARGENRRCRTVSGIVFAKPGYVAPEVANQIPGGAPADLYAYGVMLWELLAGRRFLQGDPIEHQARVAEGKLRLPQLAASVGAPARLDEILAQLTAPDPSERTGSARRAVAELAELLKQAPSLADGDRSVRGRIALFMQKLYPAEPARSRADFARRVTHARELVGQDLPSARPGIPEPSPAPADTKEEEGLLAGTRYRLVRSIAQGPMGEVWEAEHVDLGRTVALKLLPEGVARSGAARQRFRTEARVLVRLEHPGLVKLHDFGITLDGRSFYAMELLDGETLEQRITRGPLPVSEAVALARAAASALDAAHGAGILHRDITPSNLFLTSQGSVKLLDFGVAGSISEAKKEASGDAPLVVGTPEYVSPEQAAGAPSDARSDLYALGVVLYEALTGRPPHPLGETGSPSLAALLTAKITVVPTAPSLVLADVGTVVPRALDRIVLRALERDAERRFSSANELIAALDALSEKPKKKALSRRSVASAALAAACALSGAFWFASAQPAAAPAQVNLDVEASDEEPVDVASPSVPSQLGRTSSVTAAVAPVAPAPNDAVVDEAATGDASAVTSAAKEKELDAEEAEVAKILELQGRGQKIAAHHKMKALAYSNPTHPRVLEGLTLTAKAVKAWGEALEAATRRVAVEPTPAARVELARLERATLQGHPVATLQALLKEHPDYEPAQALLAEYTNQKLARQ